MERGKQRKRTDEREKSEKTLLPVPKQNKVTFWKVTADKHGFLEVIVMCMKDIEVKNQVGLHARPATFFIQKANEYKSSIWVEKEERRVNAKSLLGILSLGIVGGAQIRIIADGSDEQLAVDGLVKLVESEFAE